MRHYNEGIEVDKWCKATDQGVSAWDLCRHCGKKTVGKQASKVGLVSTNRDPLGIVSQGEYEVDYDDCEYECDLCGQTLNSRDH